MSWCTVDTRNGIYIGVRSDNPKLSWIKDTIIPIRANWSCSPQYTHDMDAEERISFKNRVRKNVLKTLNEILDDIYGKDDDQEI